MKKTYIIPANRVHHLNTSGIIAASQNSLNVYTETPADDSNQLVREEIHWKNDIFEEVW